MQVRLTSDAPLGVRTGALVLPVFSEGTEEVAKDVDDALGGTIAEALSSGEFKGKLGEVLLVHAKDHTFRRVLAVGLGERAKFEPMLLARYAGAAVRYLGRRNVTEAAIVLPPQARGLETAAASFVAEGAIAGTFETSIYQEKPEKKVAIETVSIVALGFDVSALERGLARGTTLGEAINFARRLAITPANDMTPTHLADEATKMAKATGFDIDVLDEARARAEGMGSYLSVAAGSIQPPKFIVMRYNGDPSSKEVLGLIGKGITFDTGGISIKPADRMEEMKYDMSGGAAVIAAMSAIAKLKPKINVLGVVPATENMPGGKATKPGDIVKAMNGKTIEIINTDAEGRLILADGLCYARKAGATKMVDTATLTGACVIALGHAAAALVANDDAFAKEFLDATKSTGERYWQMPYYEEYSNQMKSDIADLKNTGGRAAGTLTAAAFLRAFVDDTPWLHLDVAGTAYLENESAWQAKGPTGMPVRALVSLAEALGGTPIAGVHSNGAKAVASPA
ncbi:MAG TPA: leucyl aminopeptidase [Candidatus Baltobacteraceae bacterium]|jgi:leucyl aminopeptidase|nr:leucyl aminopeptidase [Candidatus Baltobacteraceae bacterium]